MAVKASVTITISKYRDTDSITRFYKLQASTASIPAKPTTNPPPSGWTNTEPTYTSGSTNTLYFTDLYVFSDGTFQYTEVSQSTSYEAAKEAYNKALATEEDLDNLQIGGRNLIFNSATLDLKSIYIDSDDTTDSRRNNEITYNGNYSGYFKEDQTLEHGDLEFAINRIIDIHKLNLGDELTFSEWCMINFQPSQNIVFSLYVDNNFVKELEPFTPEANKWFRLQFTFNIMSYMINTSWGNFKTLFISMKYEDSTQPFGTIYENSPKLELGNKATDWTAAPEDMDMGIGGRNLIIGSKELNNDYVYIDEKTHIDNTKFNGNNTYYFTGNSDKIHFDLQKIYNLHNDIKVGDILTLSFYIMCQQALNGIRMYGYYFYDGLTLQSGTNKPIFKNFNLKANEWIKISYTFKIKTLEPPFVPYLKLMSTNLPTDSNFKLYFSSPKLELGNKATDWTPSPEDMDRLDLARYQGRNLLKHSKTLVDNLHEHIIYTDDINFDPEYTIVYDTELQREKRVLRPKFNNNEMAYTQTQYMGIKFNLLDIVKKNNFLAGDKITISEWFMFTEPASQSTSVAPTTFSLQGLSVNDTPADVVIDTIEYNTWFRVFFTITLSNTIINSTEPIEILIANNFTDTTVDNINKLTNKLYFSSPKIELGDTITDWSICPDDLNVSIDEVNRLLNNQAELIINTVDGWIKSLVRGEGGTTLMTQDGTGWHFDMSGTNSKIGTLENQTKAIFGDDNNQGFIGEQTGTNKVLNRKTSYMDVQTYIDEQGIERPILILGNPELIDQFKITITNKEIDFVNGNSVPAYLNGNIFYGENITVKQELKIGENPGYIWKKRSNGNFGLEYINS